MAKARFRLTDSRGIRLTRSDEALEDWKGLVLANVLETHSRDAVCWGILDGCAVILSNAESLLDRSESGNSNSINCSPVVVDSSKY